MASKRRLIHGDKVLIESDINLIKSLQAGHGGWSDDLIHVAGETATFQEYNSSGDVIVQMRPGIRYCFNSKLVKRFIEENFESDENESSEEDTVNYAELLRRQTRAADEDSNTGSEGDSENEFVQNRIEHEEGTSAHNLQDEFPPGCKVVIEVPLDLFKECQLQIDNWVEDVMPSLHGEVATVSQTLSDMMVQVAFSNNQVYTINSVVLTRLSQTAEASLAGITRQQEEQYLPSTSGGAATTDLAEIVEGDIVRMLTRKKTMEQLQIHYGGFPRGMEKFLGCPGIVVKTKGEILRVRYRSNTFWLNVRGVTKLLPEEIEHWKEQYTDCEEFYRQDIIQVINDEDLFEEYNPDFANDDRMCDILGKFYVIEDVLEDTGEIKIKDKSRFLNINVETILKVLSFKDLVDKDNIRRSSNNLEESGLSQSQLANNASSSFRLQSLTTDMDQQRAFIEAVDSGNSSDLNGLLIDGNLININSLDDGESAVHRACYRGHCDVIRVLLDHGADPSLPDVDGEFPLHDIINGNQINALKLFIEKGISLTSVTPLGFTALHVAATKGFLGLCKVLVEEGLLDLAAQDFDEKNTALHMSIQHNNVEVTEYLVTMLAPVDICNESGFNPFHFAALEGSADGIRILLENHADLLNTVMTNLFTALHITAINSHVECIQLLIILGGEDIHLNPHSANGETPLHLAVGQGYVNAVNLLLDCRCDVNSTDNLGNTPLHNAARRIITGEGENAQTLMGLLSLVQNEKVPPSAYLDIAIILVKEGADLNMRNCDDLSPLDMCNDPVTKARILSYSG